MIIISIFGQFDIMFVVSLLGFVCGFGVMLGDTYWNPGKQVSLILKPVLLAFVFVISPSAFIFNYINTIHTLIVMSLFVLSAVAGIIVYYQTPK